MAAGNRSPLGFFAITSFYLCLLLAALIFGAKILPIYIALAFFAQSQLIVSDYVQHYGLRRAQREDGSYVPLGPQHSWDAPHWASSAMMMNS